VPLAPILKQRCPCCGQGKVFSGLVRMNTHCPTCGIKFERDPGYFVGAMYFSYGLAIGVAVPIVVTGYLLEWPRMTIGVVAGVVLVALIPVLFRYSRILWLHMDQLFDPRR
jgi:uncharacterized protein (DUF983 family)